MFEDKTFESILDSMLNYVQDRYPELDTNTGSMIYTALAPIALELETAYHEMDMIMSETFLETATKEYLVKFGDQIGLEINDATCGHFKGEFNVDVPIGSRFNCDEFNYAVVSKISDPTATDQVCTFELVCETAGTEPNAYVGDEGDLTPITYIPGLSYAKLVSVITYGEDEEDTEAYRYRLQLHVKNPPINGNVAQYEEWLGEYDGVGKFKVLPCWNGINTVKLVVLNSENQQADAEFVETLQRYFDPPTDEIDDDITSETYPQGRGMGDGQAPIGAIITVTTPTEVPVVVNCQVVLNPGYSSPEGVEDAVDKYLKSIIFEKNSVSYMPISATIYNCDSVADVVGLSINVKGKVMEIGTDPFIESVTLADGEIPVLDDRSVWSV